MQREGHMYEEDTCIEGQRMRNGGRLPSSMQGKRPPKSTLGDASAQKSHLSNLPPRSGPGPRANSFVAQAWRLWPLLWYPDPTAPRPAPMYR